MAKSEDLLDVLIIGAGISGIGAACHLRRECPNKRFAILERRQAMGGTWDLFRYPGIRSDSDMYTFGFAFRPWTEPRVLADGPSIRKYVQDTAAEYGVDKLIQYGMKVLSANFDTQDQYWTLEALNEATGKKSVYRARFVIGATGYYNHDGGFKPTYPDEAKFKGQIIHPQHWPEGLDYRGKRVVVIGSGATAITLVPSMAPEAQHITMLQRSPTYIMTVPAVDPVAAFLQKTLPSKIAYTINRTRNIQIARWLFKMSRSRPKAMRRLMLGMVKRQVGDAVDMAHFTPRYNPWDERLCVVPNGDLFKALKSGKASIATDHIERFTESGILLKSGKTLEADLIISATGLEIQMLGGVAMTVDKTPVPITQRMTYKGVLVQGVPNAAMIFGYTNISWTLKVDVACEYICRLLKHMDRKGFTQVVAEDDGSHLSEDTILGSLSSGYIRRAADRLPRQGNEAPWKITQDYVSDKALMRKTPIDQPELRFSRAA